MSGLANHMLFEMVDTADVAPVDLLLLCRRDPETLNVILSPLLALLPDYIISHHAANFSSVQDLRAGEPVQNVPIFLTGVM